MTTRNHTPDGLSDLSDLMTQDRGLPDDLLDADPKRRRTGRWVALIVTLIVVGALVAVPVGYIGWALSAPVAEPTAEIQQPVAPTLAPATITLPDEGSTAISIAGADEFLGAGASGIWASSGSDEARPMASITKLITAMVVLDAKPLSGPDDTGPTLTFDGADNDLYDKYYRLGATVVTMPTNSSMSQRDALAMLLIPSASNYAEAVTEWAFGSQGAFVSAARRWLAANGLTRTTVVEPTGINARNTSTPGDLIALGKLAAANPTIAQLAAAPTMTLGTPGVMRNTNDLLGVSGITGLKTGNLGENNYNLLYTASLDVGTGTPLSVTGVMLGGYSHDSINENVIALLASIDDDFHPVTLVEGGEVFGTYSTPWGSSAKLVASQSASIFTWADTPITVTMDAATPATYEDGEVVGSITWTAGPRTATTTLEIEGTITPPTEWWRLTHAGELGAE